jgi:hypothetical protein
LYPGMAATKKRISYISKLVEYFLICVVCNGKYMFKRC